MGSDIYLDRDRLAAESQAAHIKTLEAQLAEYRAKDEDTIARTIEKIEATVHDLVSNLLYYDRKEDEELPRGEIERLIELGKLSPLSLVDCFQAALEENLND